MDYRIRVLNGRQIYRVPEDMWPRVAEAMVNGGTAEKLVEPEPPKTIIERAKDIVEGAKQAVGIGVETAALNQDEPNAMRKRPPMRKVG